MSFPSISSISSFSSFSPTFRVSVSESQSQSSFSHSPPPAMAISSPGMPIQMLRDTGSAQSAPGMCIMSGDGSGFRVKHPVVSPPLSGVVYSRGVLNLIMASPQLSPLHSPIKQSFEYEHSKEILCFKAHRDKGHLLPDPAAAGVSEDAPSSKDVKIKELMRACSAKDAKITSMSAILIKNASDMERLREEALKALVSAKNADAEVKKMRKKLRGAKQFGDAARLIAEESVTPSITQPSSGVTSFGTKVHVPLAKGAIFKGISSSRTGVDGDEIEEFSDDDLGFLCSYAGEEGFGKERVGEKRSRK